MDDQKILDMWQHAKPLNQESEKLKAEAIERLLRHMAEINRQQDDERREFNSRPRPA